MRISDLSSDVCSSDLDTREADGTIFGTLARFFRIANSTPKGAQPTPADGVIAMPVSERIIRLPTVLNRDRKSVVEGKSVSVRVDIGGRRNIKKKNKTRY